VQFDSGDTLRKIERVATLIDGMTEENLTANDLDTVRRNKLKSFLEALENLTQDIENRGYNLVDTTRLFVIDTLHASGYGSEKGFARPYPLAEIAKRYGGEVYFYPLDGDNSVCLGSTSLLTRDELSRLTEVIIRGHDDYNWLSIEGLNEGRPAKFYIFHKRYYVEYIDVPVVDLE